MGVPEEIKIKARLYANPLCLRCNRTGIRGVVKGFVTRPPLLLLCDCVGPAFAPSYEYLVLPATQAQKTVRARAIAGGREL
jgi:hypothetical protein